MTSVKRWTREDMEESVAILPDDARWIAEHDYDALFEKYEEYRAMAIAQLEALIEKWG